MEEAEKLRKLVLNECPDDNPSVVSSNRHTARVFDAGKSLIACTGFVRFVPSLAINNSLPTLVKNYTMPVS